ncbi:MAG: rRNA maturation RNase YbeY [Cellvibrionales bacterium]|nr:rRNA maturation RNase YbeY [Cellvibrionales bacterium]|tara:strand:+ start:1676 stop:2140 length:465 start_codon:yes stop_codon:yes gene_type:complete
MRLHLTVDRQHSINYLPTDELLQQWANSAYANHDEKITAEAALLIVDQATITQFNRDYRRQDKATNVLSFPANLSAIDGIIQLGDIIACAPIIHAEAEQQHKSINAHWAHMMIHSTLHLQNFDHSDTKEAQTMEALEISLLEQFGFRNPYLIAD